MRKLAAFAALVAAVSPVNAHSSGIRSHAGDDFRAYVAEAQGTFDAAAEARKATVADIYAILDQISGDGEFEAATPLGRMANYYRADSDREGMDARGLAPLHTHLSAISNAQSHADIAALMADPDFVSLFAFYVFADMGEPTVNRVGIEMQAYEVEPFALPTRDHYLDESDEAAALRANYRDYVAQTLAAAGRADPQTSAAAILAIETAIAKKRWTPTQLRDREANYHPMTLAELNSFAPGFPWGAYVHRAGAPGADRYVVGTDTAIRDTAAIFAEAPVSLWKDWMTFRLIDRYAPLLAESFRGRHFAFHGRMVRGEEKAQSARGFGRTNIQTDLGRDLGREYARRSVSHEQKADMDRTVVMLKTGFDALLEDAAWMTEADRAIAREKLRKMRVYVGYPDVYRDLSSIEIRPDDPVGNRMRLGRYERARQLSLIGKPMPEGDWFWGAAYMFNAANTAQLNTITMPAGMMREFLPEDPTPAQLYGKAGHIIGHEIGHGFDDQGSKFGPDGKLEEWWSDASRANFEAEAGKLIAQISAYEVLPGKFLNGERMIGEALSDLIGAKMALAAYRLHCDTVAEAACAADPLQRDRDFFMALGANDGTVASEETLLDAVRQWQHLPSGWRINSIVRNMDAWYTAFDVRPDDRLYLPPEDRVRLYQ